MIRTIQIVGVLVVALAGVLMPVESARAQQEERIVENTLLKINRIVEKTLRQNDKLIQTCERKVQRMRDRGTAEDRINAHIDASIQKGIRATENVRAVLERTRDAGLRSLDRLGAPEQFRQAITNAHAEALQDVNDDWTDTASVLDELRR